MTDLWDYIDDEDTRIVSIGDDILELGDLLEYSKIYIDNERKKEYMSRVIPEEGYEIIAVHGNANSFIYCLEDGKKLQISPEQFAEMLKNEMRKDAPDYLGGNIHLFSCRTGEKDDGPAQQLANLMDKDVKAPTEKVWVNKRGETFITNNKALAEAWGKGKDVKETGHWRIFHPQK